MTDIIDLLHTEEGFREKPYVDTEGYPTVGYGFKIGPKIQGSREYREQLCTELYTFTVPKTAGVVWLGELVADTIATMLENNRIAAALAACQVPGVHDTENPRVAVLVSMAYQMGVAGLAGFRTTLMHIANRDWFQAETQMLKSRWATQTPQRAKRHAKQMRTGEWDKVYGG